MVDLTAVITAAENHALRCGRFERVNRAEPKSAPHTGGLTAAIWMQSLRPVLSSGLAQTSARLVLSVRIYTSMTSEPPDAIDPEVLAAVNDLFERYVGDFQLDGVANLRMVDVRGSEGIPLAAEAGYLSLDGKMLRVMTITLPLIINDAWDEVA